MTIKEQIGGLAAILLAVSVLSIQTMMWYVVIKKVPNNSEVYCPDVHVVLHGEDVSGEKEEVHE